MKTIYFLGPKGTYSELSAKKALDSLKEGYILTPVTTINKVVELVQKSSDDIGIIPIENSIEGIVRPAIDSLYLSDLYISAQVEVNIEHCFCSFGKKEDIKHIISHPQALAQCSKYILDNFDENIDLISSNSTAEAINALIEKDKTFAAIGSLSLANELKLNILDKNIGDIKDNKTRFILISKKDMNLSIKNRTSIVFNTKNEPGALLKVLEIFKKYNLNLVYLESRPSKKVFGEYNFFSDIDKGIDEIQNAMEEVKKECNFYKLLGSYSTIK